MDKGLGVCVRLFLFERFPAFGWADPRRLSGLGAFHARDGGKELPCPLGPRGALSS